MAGTREIAQKNGLKGGRPIGSKNTPTEIREQILGIFQARAQDIANEMANIAFNGKFEPTRLAALDKILDRLIGKPLQPTDARFQGDISLTVFTGVPRNDDE